MLISVIVPALNEAESIAEVLKAIPAKRDLEILVVDGGSSDVTVEIAAACGARIIHEPRRGYGRACASGLAAAQGTIVVFMDADCADDPRDISKLVAPISEGGYDLVLGSRLAGSIAAGAMPWHQLIGNWLSAHLIGVLYGLPLTDLSPFRAVSREKLLALQMEEMTYGWPTEMIVKAARRGWRIQEVPVNYRCRLGGQSKISGTWRGSLLATYFILRTIICYRWVSPA
ncbi:MAG: glycosyltransferase family 2 protein [Anaerolineales bacterium]|nr:glycosyltransferase family 2 protein [Anaerolineales bacterium]